MIQFHGCLSALQSLFVVSYVNHLLCFFVITISVYWDLIQRASTTKQFKVHTMLSSNVTVLRVFPNISAAVVRAMLQDPIEGMTLNLVWELINLRVAKKIICKIVAPSSSWECYNCSFWIIAISLNACLQEQNYALLHTNYNMTDCCPLIVTINWYGLEVILFLAMWWWILILSL